MHRSRAMPSAIGLFLMAILSVGQGAAAQTVRTAQCAAVVDGVSLSGQYQKEFWRHHNTYRHAGVFLDTKGNRYDFEVFSGSDEGVGGAWMNHMKHRYTQIDFKAYPGGLSLVSRDGQVLTFRCTATGG